MKMPALKRSPGMRRIIARLKVLGKFAIVSKRKGCYWWSAEIRVVYKCPSEVTNQIHNRQSAQEMPV
jgi:hypothetical protein